MTQMLKINFSGTFIVPSELVIFNGINKKVSPLSVPGDDWVRLQEEERRKYQLNVYLHNKLSAIRDINLEGFSTEFKIDETSVEIFSVSDGITEE